MAVILFAAPGQQLSGAETSHNACPLRKRFRRLVSATKRPQTHRTAGHRDHGAAQLLITAGGNPDRPHSDAAFAALCGASPVEANSGQRQRHRLSRGGDHAANNALWTIANNRLIHDARTRDFAEKRRQQGDSRKDTLRVLKHYIARETFALIRAALHSEQSLTEAA